MTVNLATADLFQAEIARLLDAGDRLESQLAQVALERDRLRLTDAEREFLQNLRVAYEGLANQTGYVNAAAQADSRKNAATLRGLLERTANRLEK